MFENTSLTIICCKHNQTAPLIFIGENQITGIQSLKVSLSEYTISPIVNFELLSFHYCAQKTQVDLKCDDLIIVVENFIKTDNYTIFDYPKLKLFLGGSKISGFNEFNFSSNFEFDETELAIKTKINYYDKNNIWVLDGDWIKIQKID